MYVCSTFRWSLISPAHRHRLRVCSKTPSRTCHIEWNRKIPPKTFWSPAFVLESPPGQEEKRTSETGVGDTCTGTTLDLLQPRALSSLFAAGHGTPSPCGGCSGNPYVQRCRSHVWDARVHLSLQTKLNSYIVILQIRGLLYHRFKALKLVLSFSSLFI